MTFLLKIHCFNTNVLILLFSFLIYLLGCHSFDRSSAGFCDRRLRYRSDRCTFYAKLYKHLLVKSIPKINLNFNPS